MRTFSHIGILGTVLLAGCNNAVSCHGPALDEHLKGLEIWARQAPISPTMPGLMTPEVQQELGKCNKNNDCERRVMFNAATDFKNSSVTIHNIVVTGHTDTGAAICEAELLFTMAEGMGTLAFDYSYVAQKTEDGKIIIINPRLGHVRGSILRQ